MTMQQRIRLTTGVELDVWTAGDPAHPAMIFLHGFPESHRTWRHQMAGLSDRYFCIAPDQRGYARSDKPTDLAAYKVPVLVADVLALAVVVSLVGIVVTLILSIYERTRELGMLRAVGMSRRQVKRMIRYEAVITAVLGAGAGLVLGVVFAFLMGIPLEGEGFVLSYPIPTLLAILVLSAIAGVVAAIYPARKAARLDVLEAISYE